MTVPKGPIYDYTIEIVPKPKSKDQRLRLWVLIEGSAGYRAHAGYVAHDQSTRLVSAKQLPQPLTIRVTDTDGPQDFTVHIRYERNLNMDGLNKYLDGRADSKDYDPLPLISAFNLVLQRMASSNGVRVGQTKYFYSSLGQFHLGTGIQGWKGFFMSVRPGYKQLWVNV
jgi:eukaryotic translation initiation factor 2C